MKKQNALVVLSALTLSTVASADDAAKFGGFVDAQTTVGTAKFAKTDNGTYRLSNKINDGALYFSKSLGGGSAAIDLPFNLITSGATNLNFANSQAQAYVNYGYSNGVSWRMGQFDGIFGLERNDSKDVLFTEVGQIRKLAQPIVHTGLMVGYELSKTLNFQALVTSVADTGPLTITSRNNAAGNKTYEYGGKISYSDAFRLSLGTLMHKVRDVALVGATNASNESESYINVTAGTKVDHLNLDVEYTTKSYYAASTITPNRKEKVTGSAIGAIASYELNDSTNVAARFQTLSKIDASHYSMMEVTVGPQFQMTKDLRVKADLTMSSMKAAAGADSISNNHARVAAVYSF